MKKAPKQLTISKKRFNYQLLLLALPGLFFLVAFYYVPLFGMVLPFKSMDYAKGIWGSPFVGFDNFKFFFESNDAALVTRNTIFLNLMFISVTIVIAISLALMLFEFTKTKVKIFQTAIFVPYFISWVAAGYILYAFLNPTLGVIPNALEEIGLLPPNFYFEPEKWPGILLLSFIWKNIGYFTLLFYAALLGIDPMYYEAAEVDGANKLQQIFKISIPFISPVIIIFSLLQIGKIMFADFGMFYFLPMNSGMLYETTSVIDTYVFRLLKNSGDIGMSAAVGMFQSVTGFALVLLSNMLVRKTSRENAMF